MTTYFCFVFPNTESILSWMLNDWCEIICIGLAPMSFYKEWESTVLLYSLQRCRDASPVYQRLKSTFNSYDTQLSWRTVCTNSRQQRAYWLHIKNQPRDYVYQWVTSYLVCCQKWLWSRSSQWATAKSAVPVAPAANLLWRLGHCLEGLYQCSSLFLSLPVYSFSPQTNWK